MSKQRLTSIEAGLDRSVLLCIPTVGHTARRKVGLILRIPHHILRTHARNKVRPRRLQTSAWRGLAVHPRIASTVQRCIHMAEMLFCVPGIRCNSAYLFNIIKIQRCTKLSHQFIFQLCFCQDCLCKIKPALVSFFL